MQFPSLIQKQLFKFVRILQEELSTHLLKHSLERQNIFLLPQTPEIFISFSATFSVPLRVCDYCSSSFLGVPVWFCFCVQFDQFPKKWRFYTQKYLKKENMIIIKQHIYRCVFFSACFSLFSLLMTSVTGSG